MQIEDCTTYFVWARGWGRGPGQHPKVACNSGGVQSRVTRPARASELLHTGCATPAYRLSMHVCTGGEVQPMAVRRDAVGGGGSSVCMMSPPRHEPTTQPVVQQPLPGRACTVPTRVERPHTFDCRWRASVCGREPREHLVAAKAGGQCMMAARGGTRPCRVDGGWHPPPRDSNTRARVA
jgi:hypothetical protein